MRKSLIAGIVIALLLAAGQCSGKQPELDSVAAASTELGLPFEGRFIDVGEVTLHVVFAGPEDGPPVVLLHGFPEFWYAWRGPAAVLARAGFRVIVPDQRGYNLSDKPDAVADYRLDHLVRDVVGLADALDYQRVSIGCQDWGSTVGWRTLLEHPDRVDRFAVINAGHPLAFANASGDEDKVSWYQTFIQIPWLPGFSARLNDWALLASSLRDSSAAGAFPEEEMDQLRSAWDRDGAIHTMGAWYRAEAWPYQGSREDARVANPVMILLAASDAFIPAQPARDSAAYLQDSRLVELGSGTHWVTAEEPERIGALLAEFFAPVATP